MQSAKHGSQESSEEIRRRLADLESENKKLTKQKTELLAAFKKQLQLIGILKRQKLHLEAAKMLSFTEEEFAKTLDWGAK